MQKMSRRVWIASIVLVSLGILSFILNIIPGYSFNIGWPLLIMLLGATFFILAGALSKQNSWGDFLFIPGGLLLALAVLFWIPTHIMTFSIRRFDDYQAAGIPTFPSTYGIRATQAIIAASSLAAALAIGVAAVGIGVTWGYLRVLVLLSTGLLALAIASLARPSDKVNFGLFKYASLYMLSAMLLLAI